MPMVLPEGSHISQRFPQNYILLIGVAFYLYQRLLLLYNVPRYSLKEAKIE